jgi:alkyl hydroperoxide reductase subunit AhpF
MQEKLLAERKVAVFHKTCVLAVEGDRFVTGIRIGRGGKEESLAVQGVFVEIGLIPNSEFAEGVARNERGEIKVDSYNRTNISGIFAAGDVTDVPEKQIVIAAGEGAKAALGVFRYLNQTR